MTMKSTAMGQTAFPFLQQLSNPSWKVLICMSAFTLNIFKVFLKILKLSFFLRRFFWPNSTEAQFSPENRNSRHKAGERSVIGYLGVLVLWWSLNWRFLRALVSVDLVKKVQSFLFLPFNPSGTNETASLEICATKTLAWRFSINEKLSSDKLCLNCTYLLKHLRCIFVSKFILNYEF